MSSLSSDQQGHDSSTQQQKSRIIHCNHAGASPSPPSVVNTVIDHLRLEQRLGGYTAAEQASGSLRGVYQRVYDLLHVSKPNDNERLPKPKDPTHEIALVESATVAWTRLFYAMVQFQHQRRLQQIHQQQGQTQAPRPLVILVSEAEYAANVVAACQWARDHASDPCCPWTVLSIPSVQNESSGSSTGILDLQVFQEMLQGTYQYQVPTADNTLPATTMTLNPADIAMVCITHIPTNSGIVNHVEDIGTMILDWNNKPSWSVDEVSFKTKDTFQWFATPYRSRTTWTLLLCTMGG